MSIFSIRYTDIDNLKATLIQCTTLDQIIELRDSNWHLIKKYNLIDLFDDQSRTTRDYLKKPVLGYRGKHNVLPPEFKTWMEFWNKISKVTPSENRDLFFRRDEDTTSFNLDFIKARCFEEIQNLQK